MTTGWTSAEITALLRGASERVMALDSFAHHVAKASVELVRVRAGCPART